MIDLHCHLLPGIDDGATDIEISVAMARAAVADGITMTACTPHIMPGVYNNNRSIIEERMAAVTKRLADEGIDLKLIVGADVHMDVELVSGLKSGRIPSLNNSRYFLFEPPHHVPPPRLEENVFSIMSAGYVPILTHPERLSWIETHYAMMERLVRVGVIMQITAGSMTGQFGRRVRHWADRMLDEGLVHILATDAHNLSGRSANLSKARDIVAERLGEEESVHMTVTRPQGMVDNVPPHLLAPQPPREVPKTYAVESFLSRFGLGRRGRVK